MKAQSIEMIRRKAKTAAVVLLATSSVFAAGIGVTPRVPEGSVPGVYKNDSDYLIRKFREDVTDRGTGLNAHRLKEGVENFAANLEGKEPWQLVKAKLLAYMCDNIAIGCSEHDWFPSFACWNRFCRPLGNVVYGHAERIADGDYGKTRRLGLAATQVGRFSMWLDFDHSAPDWDEMFALGWPGLERRLYDNWRDEPYYESLKVTIDAIKRLLKRLSDHARQKAAETSSGSLAHTRLLAQADALGNILSAPPRTCYEVLMFQYVYFYVSEYLDMLQVRSCGNLDRLLTPFYRADIAAGRTTDARFREHLRHYWWQFGSIDNYWCQPVWIGGTKKDGTSEFNEVSDIVLDVHDELALPTPKMIVKISKTTPQRVFDRMLDMSRRHRSLVFVSEETMAKILKGWRHCTDEECRTCEMNGCYEFYVRGRQNVTQSSHVSYVYPIAALLADATKGNFTAGSFDDFLCAYTTRLTNTVEECMALTDRWERLLPEINPASVYSLTVPSSLKSGRDAFFNGLDYNDTAMLSVGLGTAVDALLAVKELVYESGELSLAELGAIMAADWKDHEDLRMRMLRSKRKWGNNNREANDLGGTISKRFADCVNGRPNARGGIWGFSGHSARQFIELGATTGATPDGRKAGDELSKNMSPVMGMDTEGVTAMIQTYAKLNPVDFPINFPVDVMLHPSAVEGQQGLDAMNALARVYFGNGGTSIQFNVFNAEELKDAQRHPEKYENLQIRVCGWNVRWNDLPKVEQDKYIYRAEALAR